MNNKMIERVREWLHAGVTKYDPGMVLLLFDEITGITEEQHAGKVAARDYLVGVLTPAVLDGWIERYLLPNLRYYQLPGDSVKFANPYEVHIGSARIIPSYQQWWGWRYDCWRATLLAAAWVQLAEGREELGELVEVMDRLDATQDADFEGMHLVYSKVSQALGNFADRYPSYIEKYGLKLPFEVYDSEAFNKALLRRIFTDRIDALRGGCG